MGYGRAFNPLKVQNIAASNLCNTYSTNVSAKGLST